MREIKFRAWDKKAKRWIHHEESGLLFLNFEITGGGIFHLHDETSESGRDSYDFMQYTGLKDKNDACIFESDIIKGDLYDSRLPIMGEVVFDDHFSFYANKNEAGNTPLHRINNIEIIGNIYELVDE